MGISKMNVFEISKTFKILSIDFDVFYDLGKQFIPSIQKCNMDWTVNYNTNSDTMERTFYYNLYYPLKGKIHSANCPIYVSEDHSHIAKIIDKYYPNMSLDIVNYDRHCDLSQKQIKTGKLNCANWVGWLGDRCHIMNYDWVCWSNDYYEKAVPEFIDNCKPEIQQFPINGISNKIHRLGEEYDLIFIIQSYDYSPPHMYHRFRELYEEIPNVTIDDSFPLWEMSYTESVKRLKDLEYMNFIKDKISPYSGKPISVFMDPDLGDNFSEDMADDEDSTIALRQDITRDEFIEMFGECDPQYAE